MKYLLFLITSLLLPVSVLASSPLQPSVAGKMQLQATQMSDSNFSTTMTVGDVISYIIEAFLSLLALIFIILTLIAGYQYFTAQGNEAKTKEALSSIRTAIIGLILILTAYALTYFVFSILEKKI